MTTSIKRICVILSVPVIAFFLQGCPLHGYKYNMGKIPDNPVNFADMNTEYDDYNMTAPTVGETFPLCFSTNRNSLGARFDVIFKTVTIEFDKTTGDLGVFENRSWNLDHVRMVQNLQDAVTLIRTDADELGPYALFMDNLQDPSVNFGWYSAFLFLYSTGISGDQDIWFTQNLDSLDYAEPRPVQFLNSGSEDAYPCLNGDRTVIYFCSDREGNFDIFRAVIGGGEVIQDLLASDQAFPVEKDTLLSSEGNDKCPFIAYSYELWGDDVVQNNLLVFASDREGGYGGYDLYYSNYSQGTWSEPVNFGPVINTEYNEFRPIVRPQGDFDNDFMLFSSDRPGGKGGYDLYYVGIPDIGFPFW
jgi:hypothetical protein